MEFPLKTERLIIRRFENSEIDMAGIFEIMSDKDVNQYLPWYPLAAPEEAVAFFKERILPRYQNDDGYYFAICLKESEKPIGYITVSGDERHDFGYGLKKEFWGKGIVTEAASYVLDYLKSQGWQYVTATHDIHNVGSGIVTQKLGMTYKYSYKEQWQPKDFEVTFRMYQLNFDDADRVYQGYWEKYPQHCIEPASHF